MTDRIGSETTMRGGGMRSRIVSMTLLAVFGVIAVKGATVALTGASETNGVSTAFAETTQRADIVDRNGELLATSVTVYSLFADPRAMMDGALVAQELAIVLPELDVATITERLDNKERAFVWIQRGLTPRQRQAVFELGLEGIGFREETRRAYPRGTLAGHVLGYTGIDGDGLGGVELAMDSRLSEGGDPLVLTLDSNVQFSLEAELAAAVGQYDAEAASGIVMQANTGQVLGMASWPPLDPNRATSIAKDAPERLDRASGAVYELGSVFKPLTVAGAIDSGSIRPSDMFDVREPLVVRGRKISDDHPIAGRATVTEIITESSNIGTVKVAWQMGARRQQELFSNLGLLDRAPIELAASEGPLLPAEFDDLNSAVTSYGHAIAVTPIAFTAAFATLANAGEYNAPSLIQTKDKRASPRRVMSAPTAALMTHMMREAVITGTGKQAEVAGYRVAGKTGTAEKPIPGGYSETDNMCSFAALFPADGPEYVVLIVLDNPKAGANRGRTAAWNAAPTAGRVIERIAPILGVEPRFDALPQSGPKVRSVSDRRRSDL
ncbi:MAG: penicillin-binding protein 2 [Pseudomonadota bacterium]